jgi:DNA-binding transcriptional LysR family regulator
MIEKINGDFLQWLRGFHFVVTHGSITAAAQAMGLRQPTVSHQIKMLEAELGVQLFQRTLHKMQLTPQGHALHERSLVLFEQVRSIKEEVGRPQEGTLKGEISVITTHSIAINYLTTLIQSFRTLHPQTTFTITGASEYSLILDKVHSSAFDLGIVHERIFPPTIECMPLFSTPLVLIVAKEYAERNGWRFTRAANGSLADLRELAGMPYVGFTPDAMLTHYLYEILARYQISVNITVRVNTSGLLACYVANGFGVTILDAFTAAADPGVFDCYPLSSVAANRLYHVVFRKRAYVSPQTRAFIKYLRKTPIRMDGIIYPQETA